MDHFEIRMASNGTSTNEDAEKALAIERLLESPMPWIGMYIAAASLACTLAMAADALHGFLKRKHWFPSKYFSLNATSLTLLAVAMKLPMDLTARMYTVTDRLAKISTLIFMSICMANSMTSLGSMTNKDVLSNIVALAILVVTVIGNVAIQVIELRSYLSGRRAFIEESLAIVGMILLLVMLTSSSLMTLSTKRYLEMKYHEMHRSALHEDQTDVRRTNTDKLTILVKRYWVMAETSSPQFVVARSSTCISSGVLSLLIAFVLVEAEIRMAMRFRLLRQIDSSYGWSTEWVLLIQTIGVVVGAIAPSFRLYAAIKTISLNEGRKTLESAVMVEDYWTQKLVEWRESPLHLQFRHLLIRKLLHYMRKLFLNFCISIQYLIVLCSKTVLFVTVCLTNPAISVVRRLKRQIHVSSSVDPEVDIKNYVILLEGEVELLTETVESICKEVDNVISKGKMRHPKDLLNLLRKSCDFRGVVEFDSDRVPNLSSRQIPYCWSLPIVTLSCIALSLPNIEKNKSESLLSSVNEGLRYVKIIDKTMDKKGSLINVRTAANVVWVEAELYHKWQDKDLYDKAVKVVGNWEVVLQELCTKGEKMVMEFERGTKSCLMRNPLNWPSRIAAANSMYRVSRTILMNNVREIDGDELFEKLTVMIADILVACFTNLGRVIMKKCRRNEIEKREKSVRKAALLLGETEDIIALLQQREVPVMAPDRAADIEEWRRVLMKRESGESEVDVLRWKGGEGEGVTA